MRNLFDMKGGKMHAVFGMLAERMPPEIGDEIIADPDNVVGAMVAAAEAYLYKNPFEMTVDDQIGALRLMNVHMRPAGHLWENIPDEVFERLAATAPPWPKGRHAFRSFRIRFDEGDEGVAKTFEAHCECIKRVFGGNRYDRFEYLRSGNVPHEGKSVERLRLLNGNHTHKPIIEWVMTDLDTHRTRDGVTAVRDATSLADELLVIAWLFPHRIKAIDYAKFPGLFAAGYEANVPEYDSEAWQRVVLVGHNRVDRRVSMRASGRGDNCSDCSVPVLLKLPALVT